jgi:hypothetical protein
MTGPERVRDALAHPERYPAWKLDCLRGDANYYRMFAEEAALRQIVKERETRSADRKES